MATLPTFEVSPATAQRLMAAFEGETDGQTGVALTPVQAYKRWLRQQLVQRVLDSEAEAHRESLTPELPI